MSAISPQTLRIVPREIALPIVHILFIYPIQNNIYVWKEI